MNISLAFLHFKTPIKIGEFKCRRDLTLRNVESAPTNVTRMCSLGKPLERGLIDQRRHRSNPFSRGAPLPKATVRRAHAMIIVFLFLLLLPIQKSHSNCNELGMFIVMDYQKYFHVQAANQ